MEALRRTFRLIRVNWRTLVCFELFYKAAVAVGFTLLVSLGFRLVMRVMGLSYLTREGIGGIAAELPRRNVRRSRIWRARSVYRNAMPGCRRQANVR